MKLIINIPDEAVQSVEKWLDSELNIVRAFDDKGQLLNQRRVPNLEAAVEQHVDQFFSLKLIEYPPSTPELDAANQARIDAEQTTKDIYASIMEQVTVDTEVVE